MTNTANCSSCHAPIIWAITEAGKPIPIDLGSTVGNIVPRRSADNRVVAHVLTAAEIADSVDEPRFTSHFATCPYADQHRRRP